MGRAQSQEPRLFDQDTCVGDPLERHALLRQGHPERHANRSAPTHALQYALAHSDQAHAVVNTAWPEPPLRDLESSAFAKQNIVGRRSEEHTSELQSLMRISYAVFCLKKKKPRDNQPIHTS